jgi:hypothetical protein
MHLMTAVSEGDISKVKLMVENGISPDVSDYDLRTSIHIAASDGMLLSVAFLVEKCNCEVNPVDRWKKTPMQVAPHLIRCTYISRFLHVPILVLSCVILIRHPLALLCAFCTVVVGCDGSGSHAGGCATACVWWRVGPLREVGPDEQV